MGLPGLVGADLRELDFGPWEGRVRRFAVGLPAAGPGDVVVIAHRGSLAVMQALLTGCELSDMWAAGFEWGAVRAAC